MFKALQEKYVYPYMIFSVLFNSELRMLELNLVDNVLIDRFKDHKARPFHFTMIERVLRGFKLDEFVVEFNNEKKAMKFVCAF